MLGSSRGAQVHAAAPGGRGRRKRQPRSPQHRPPVGHLGEVMLILCSSVVGVVHLMPSSWCRNWVPLGTIFFAVLRIVRGAWYECDLTLDIQALVFDTELAILLTNCIVVVVQSLHL